MRYSMTIYLQGSSRFNLTDLSSKEVESYVYLINMIHEAGEKGIQIQTCINSTKEQAL